MLKPKDSNTPVGVSHCDYIILGGYCWLFSPNLRLIPVSQWKREESFTEYGPKCIQSDGTGSEDCLYMNILVPGKPILETLPANTKLPVLVFIHGGAFKDDNGEGQLINEDFELYENDGRGKVH